MNFYEKNYAVLITGAVLMIAFTVIFRQDSLKINNLIIILVGSFMGVRLHRRRKEFNGVSGVKDNSNKVDRLFFKTDLMDERERIIHLKSNNISLVFALLLSYLLFFVMNDLNMFEELKATWFFYILSGYMLSKGVSGFVYSRLISVSY